MPPKYRDVLRQLREDGWFKTKQVGSHQQFKHPTKPGKVTVAGRPGQDVPPQMLASILKQAGLERDPK